MLKPKTIASLVGAWAVLLAFQSSLATVVVEQVIVAIDGEPYTLSNINDYAHKTLGRDFPLSELNSITEEDKEALEFFITDRLIAAEVKRLGISVSEEDIDQYIERIMEKNRLTDSELAEALRREGVSIEKYRASVRAEIEKGEIIDAQVRKRVNVTPEDVERYYQANRKKFATEERVRLRHILLSLPKDATPEREKEVLRKALEIHEQALAGKDFAALARQYSEGGGASEGGDIGWIKHGSLVKEIEDEAFRLPRGAISQPVRTSVGVHLIKVEDKDPERVLPLQEVSGKIKEELYAKALEERFQKWLKTDLRKRHRVDVKLPGVVFRPEETKEGTVDSLMTSTSRRAREEESGFLSYLNPLSYIVKKTPVEGENADGELSGQTIISVFGVPLFVAEADYDVPEEPFPAPSEAKATRSETSEQSDGFFSSVWRTLNPFSK